MPTGWPHWWTWELELSPHLRKRMLDRSFSETDLRAMMEGAIGIREKDDDPGRWIVTTMYDSAGWEVIVEPDAADKLLVVVTAYPLG
jgi:hypothetical protein